MALTMFIEYVPGTKHAGTKADRSETMDAFTDCGMLLTNEDVVIDIDHLPKDSIKAMISEFGLKTRTIWTDRGVHLWFKKPAWFVRRKDGICRLGFEIEQHTMATNPEGMTVKRNGVPRQIDNMDNMMYLPPIFNVDTKYRTKYTNLTSMGDGEGRNKALYQHRLSLEKNNVGDVDRILSFINFHVFAEPLPNTELENILRDMPVNDDKENMQSLIASTIMSECRTVVYSGRIWWYKNGDYISDEKNSRLIRRIYQACEGEKSNFIEEVVKQIAYRSPLVDEDTVFPIRFRNGILRNGVFIKMKDYQEFTPYYIDIDYKEDAEPVQIVDDYIDNLTDKDPDYRKLLMEVIGYVMVTDPERIRSLGKFFMFRGDGANGKGTLLQIMKRIYNPKNCTNLSIKQLTDERYKVTMIGKLANLGDDIEPSAINDGELKVLKNISTADTVTTRHMYSESVSATFTVKLYFTTNSDIKSFEKGYAYKRRIVWLPMFNKVDKPDSRFITKITTKPALEYWIRLIVEGYKRLYTEMQWTNCKVVDEYNQQYHESNNVCHQFAKDLDPETEIVGKTLREMKEAFYQWDSEDAKFSNKNFTAAVWELYGIGIGVSRVAGKSRRVFLYQKDTKQTLQH